MIDNSVAETADPGRQSDELTTLTEFLDFYRTVLLRKAAGLTPEHLSSSAGCSSLTIGKLIRHMTLVEDHWFDNTFAGLAESEPWASTDWDADPDWEMTIANGIRSPTYEPTWPVGKKRVVSGRRAIRFVAQRLG